MSTKKLQIVTPIVTSVNGQTGDVTLDISGGGGGASTPMKKLTFTGGATGEYDGSSNVSVAIPEDRIYELHMTQNDNDTFTISNDFDEAIAAQEAGKIITGPSSIINITNYEIPNPDRCHLYVTIGDIFIDVLWEKATGIGTLKGYYNMPSFNMNEESTLFTSSGAVYWDSVDSKWTIKDISGSSGDVYILNLDTTKTNDENTFYLINSLDSFKEAIDTKKILYYQDTIAVGSYQNDLLGLYTSNSFTGKGYQYWGSAIEGTSLKFTQMAALDTPVLYRSDAGPPLSDRTKADFSKSGAVYWDKDQDAYILKDISYKAGNGISISDDGTISVTAAKMYSGTNTPADSLGENGDIYIQTEG